MESVHSQDVPDFAGQLSAYVVKRNSPRPDGRIHPGSVSVFGEWSEESQTVVDALNGKRLWSMGYDWDVESKDYARKLMETPPLLREMFHAWRDSGPNLSKLKQSHPKLCAAVDRCWKASPVELFWGDSGKAAYRHTAISEPCRTSYDEAVRMFTLLITNPMCEKIAGPCSRCGTYYIKKRASQKVYCSRRCGNTATATATARERRIAGHMDKLRRAAEAAGKWRTARTKLEWKQWVSQKEVDITPKFLTRAVNNKELVEPVKEGDS